ncbi:MAG TPA: hypothetical protein VFW87_14555 [Pirellulales bacterium]|nr:hypothetical protein [Pirellulales bacterium]
MKLRMCVIACLLATNMFLMRPLRAAAQTPRYAAQVTPQPNVSPDQPPQGRAENRWRYRFHRGTWWYWTAGNAWARWNGDMWVPYTGQPDVADFAPGSLLGPIAGPTGLEGVFLRGPQAGLIRVGDRASTKMLPRGTVMPRFLRGEFTENPALGPPRKMDSREELGAPDEPDARDEPDASSDESAP